MKKSYKVLHPIGFGGRVERGEVIELTDADAKSIGSDLVQLLTEEVPQAPAPEIPLEKMTQVQLVEKAKVLGLPHSGTKSDLYERIKLHLQGEESN